MGYPPALARRWVEVRCGEIVDDHHMTEGDFRRYHGQRPWLDLPDGTLVWVLSDDNIVFIHTTSK